MHARSRRRFLQTCAATALAGGAGPGRLLAAAGSEKPLPLGFSLYGMPGLAVPEALKTCAQIGSVAVELVVRAGAPTDSTTLSPAARADLRKLLADLNLSLPGLMENLAAPVDDTTHRANLDRIKAAAELAHTLAPDRPPVIETTLGGKRDTWPAVKDTIIGRVADWAKAAARGRIVLAVKAHAGNAMNTPEAALELLRVVDNPALKLAFDYSHFQVRKLPLAETIRALVPHSVFIHVKDARGEPAKFEFLLPGDGDVDYREYARLIRAAGYRGAVVVEVSGQIFNRPGFDAVGAARRCFEQLAPAFRGAA
jgi:sugar phosphate isomerase/epimerase